MTEEPRGLSLEPDRSSRHSLGIYASPAEVYQALTDPTELSHWFVPEASVDLRPGGAYRWVFGEATGSPGAGLEVAAGEFVEVIPHEFLALTSQVEGVDTRLEFRLDPWREGTVVTVTHAGFPGEEEWDETFGSIDRGWESELYALKIYLERARGMVRRSRYHEARIPATPEAIFDAFSTTSGLEGWLADRAAVEPGPGGELRLEWDGQPAIKGHFGIWDPDRFLLLIWEGERPSLVRVWMESSEEAGEKEPSTELALEHRLFAQNARSIKLFDWDGALARLAEALRGPRAG